MALWGAALTLACGGDPLEELRSLQAGGDHAAALAVARDLLSERSGDAEVQYRYGMALHRSGQSGLAEWSLREAMKDAQWRRPAALLLVNIRLGTGGHDMALSVLNELLGESPDDTGLLLMRAEAYAGTRRHYAEALEDADRVLEEQPDNAAAYSPRVVSLIGLDRIDEADEALAELGRLIEEQSVAEPVRAWHCVTSALFAEEGANVEGAAALYERCLEQFPADAEVVRRSVEFYDARGEGTARWRFCGGRSTSRPRTARTWWCGCETAASSRRRCA